MSTAAPPQAGAGAEKPENVGLSERAKSERKLAWMLCAPAVVMMILVTAYPIGYAIVLSLQDIDLRFPDQGGWAGLDNYITVLTAPLWWGTLFNTVFITVVSVVIELVLGMAIALVMHRAIFGRGAVRTSVLIPYGIITVVAAFAWFYAFDPSTGFVNNLPFVADDQAWFGERWTSMAVIIAAEVWKTTPFMALLFRTLDAFRVFDSIFVMTRGAQDTQSVSILGYDQLISRLNLGLGSAVSVLIFICVLAIAFLFVKGFGASVPGQEED